MTKYYNMQNVLPFSPFWIFLLAHTIISQCTIRKINAICLSHSLHILTHMHRTSDYNFLAGPEVEAPNTHYFLSEL